MVKECVCRVCVCADRLCQGDRVRVFGDSESGAVTPQENAVTLCLSFTDEEFQQTFC